jgi:ABC-type xylose transport system permease subunit
MTDKLEKIVAPRPRRGDRNAWAMAGVLVALWAVLAVLPATRGVFLTDYNLQSLLAQNAHVLVIAVGMTLVVLIRGIDLSVGAGVALTGVVAAMLQAEGQPAWVAIAAALGVGAAIGLWQGVWIARLGLPAFIVTLAGFFTFRGLALVASDTRSFTMGDDFAIVTRAVPPAATFAIVLAAAAGGIALVVRDAARRRALGLPPPTAGAIAARAAVIAVVATALLFVFADRGMPALVLVAGAVTLAGVALTRATRFGRHLYAIGGNPEAARLAGIPVRRVTVWVYVLVGLTTAIGGVLLAGRVNSVTPGSQGQLLELEVVTAVVIGGTSLFGGRGSVIGTLLGVLVFGTIANGMNLLGIDSNWQLICKGQILMLAVMIDVLLKGKRS